jgi:hypothetical protein
MSGIPAMTTEPPSRAASRGKTLKRVGLIGGIVLVVLAAGAVALAMTGEADTPIAIVSEDGDATADLRRVHRRATSRIESVAPRGVWLAVDTIGGKLRVYRGRELLREAACSAGSGVSLRDPRNGRVWTFRTPTGERTVIRKVRNPVWTKPDWAFIEEGYEPPPIGARDRRDDFSLGDYALYLGDGYMIHGTVFQTLVGRPVTHGCIRLRDEDLEYVYRMVPMGARVLLY